MRSPFREDKNPTCGFYYSKAGKLYLHDFGTGEHFDVFEIVKRLYNIRFPQAIDKILAQTYDKIEAIDLDRHKDCFYLPGEPDIEYFTKLGIKQSTLELYDVTNAKALYTDEILSWRATKANPIFIYNFPSGRFKAYRPLSKDKTKKWKSNTKITDVGGALQLPPKGKLLFVTSSLKDVMVLYEMKFPAVCFPSEIVPTSGTTGEFVKTFLSNMKERFEHIIFFMDNDATGLEQSIKLSKHYRLPYVVMPIGYPKDISDYVAKHNLLKAKRLIKKLISKLYNDKSSNRGASPLLHVPY